MEEVRFFRLANQKTRTEHVGVHEQSTHPAEDALCTLNFLKVEVLKLVLNYKTRCKCTAWMFFRVIKLI